MKDRMTNEQYRRFCQGEYDPRLDCQPDWRLPRWWVPAIWIGLAAAAFLWIAGLFASAMASAQTTGCAPRSELVGALADRLAGRQVATGLIDEWHVLEFFAGDGARWTALITRSDGLSCPLMSGVGWTMIVPTPETH